MTTRQTSGRQRAPRSARRSRPTGSTSASSRRAPRLIELLLFDDAERRRPSRVVRARPAAHRTYHYWHVFVPGLQPGQVYAYRAHGPFAPERGLRFDPQKVLLDPVRAGGRRAARLRPRRREPPGRQLRRRR